jgi:hypothetical protein
VVPAAVVAAVVPVLQATPTNRASDITKTTATNIISAFFITVFLPTNLFLLAILEKLNPA